MPTIRNTKWEQNINRKATRIPFHFDIGGKLSSSLTALLAFKHCFL